MWNTFRINGRELEWCVVPGGARTRRLFVRSLTGEFYVQSMILDDAFAKPKGYLVASLVGTPLILGKEFPLGTPAPVPPPELAEAFEIAEYGIIHTEFVRSLVERWAHRSRYRGKTRGGIDGLAR